MSVELPGISDNKENEAEEQPDKSIETIVGENSEEETMTRDRRDVDPGSGERLEGGAEALGPAVGWVQRPKPPPRTQRPFVPQNPDQNDPVSAVELMARSMNQDELVALLASVLEKKQEAAVKSPLAQLQSHEESQPMAEDADLSVGAVGGPPSGPDSNIDDDYDIEKAMEALTDPKAKEAERKKPGAKDGKPLSSRDERGMSQTSTDSDSKNNEKPRRRTTQPAGKKKPAGDFDPTSGSQHGKLRPGDYDDEQFMEIYERMEARVSEKYVRGFKDSVHNTAEKDIRPMLKQSKENMDASKATMEKVEKTLTKFEALYRAQEKELHEMKSQLKAVKNHVINSSVSKTWIIPDFSELSKQGGRIGSDPFFTSLNLGYKLRACLFPNGIGKGTGTHLSVCWHLMPNERDDFLEWPFQYSVKFKLLPSPGARSAAPPLMAATGITAKKLAFHRPTEDNPLSPDRFEGIEDFVVLKEVQQSYIWPDGSIAIEISAWPLENF